MLLCILIAAAGNLYCDLLINDKPIDECFPFAIDIIEENLRAFFAT